MTQDITRDLLDKHKRDAAEVFEDRVIANYITRRILAVSLVIVAISVASTLLAEWVLGKLKW